MAGLFLMSLCLICPFLTADCKFASNSRCSCSTAVSELLVCAFMALAADANVSNIHLQVHDRLEVCHPSSSQLDYRAN